jgi:hypothetical protein
LFPLAIGEALSTPVLVAALRRYTAPAQRSVAFSLFYALMNFGFLVGYFVFDGVREYLKANGGLVIPFGIGELSPYRTLFLVSLLVDTLMWPVVFALRARVEMTDSGLVEAPQAEALVSGNAWQTCWAFFVVDILCIHEIDITDMNIYLCKRLGRFWCE